MAKRKKISKIIAPILLLIAVALLITGFLILKKSSGNADAETDSSEEAINIITSSSDDISRLVFTNENGEISLEKSGDKWIKSDDTDFPLNQDTVEALLGEASTINAVRTVDGAENADYGFDDPKCTVIVTYNDGAIRTYKAGDVNSYNSNQYLLCDDGRIYMISTDFANAFSKTEGDLLINESFPDEITEESTIDIVISNANGKANTINDDDGKTKAMEAFNELEFLTVGRKYAPGGSMAEYGITESSPHVTVKYNVTYETSSAEETTENSGAEGSGGSEEKSFTLRFGNTFKEEDNEYIYYSYPGSVIVYSIEKSKYDAMMEFAEYVPQTESSEETMLS